MNLLSNGSFERGWTDLLPWGALTNQQPRGFSLFIRRPGVRLVSASTYTGPDEDPLFLTVVNVPECVHKSNAQLPADERLGGEDALVLEGEYTFKVFSATNPFSVDLGATVVAPGPGHVFISIPVQVHDQGDPSIGAAVWRVLVDGAAFAWQTFVRDFDSREWLTFGTGLPVTAGQVVSITLQMESRALGGIDFFTDNWRAEFTPLPTEQPEPEPCVCPGGPREDFPRTVHVIAGDATDARRAEIARIAVVERKQTCGPSYDDAGIGDLTSKTAVLWDIPSERRAEFVSWYKQHYPGTVVRFAGGTVVPPVEPPVGGEPPALPAPASLIGLHMQNPKAGWLDYYRAVHPGVYKALQLGMCLEVRDASPDTLVVYRHHVNNDGSWVHRPNLQIAAREFLDLYAVDFELAAKAKGVTVAKLLDRLDVIESLNEVIGNHDPELEPAVEFDCYFAEAVEQRYGNALKAGLLTIPVGNPHETEFVKLLPAARVAADGGHYLTYHGYWGANAERSYLAATWPQIAGRWAEWDKVFTAAGVYPRYYLGESGICYSQDGWNLNPNLGWKGCGPFNKYITDLQNFDRLGKQWNAAHANRFRGAAIFCYGGYGWEGYDFEPGDLADLGAALV